MDKQLAAPQFKLICGIRNGTCTMYLTVEYLGCNKHLLYTLCCPWCLVFTSIYESNKLSVYVWVNVQCSLYLLYP